MGIEQLRGQQKAPHPFILSPPIGIEMSGEEEVEKERKRDKKRCFNAFGPKYSREGRAVEVRAESLLVLRRASIASDRGEMEKRSEKASSERLKVAKGSELKFHLTLMGRAAEYLPYMVYAVSEMAHRGLGAERARFELRSVAMIDEAGDKKTIYAGDSQRITVPADSSQPLSRLIESRLDELNGEEAVGDRLKLRFLTPARIRTEGDLQSRLSFELLIRNLLRRVSLLALVHGSGNPDLDYRGLIALAGEVSAESSSLRWWDWERYSNRQQTKMKMGGFIGDIEYRGEVLKEFLPLIAAGELLHVGAGTGFGLGRYAVMG